MIIVDYKTYFDAQHGKRLDIDWTDAVKMFASPKALAPVGTCPTTDVKSDEYKQWKKEVDDLKKKNGYVFWGDTKDGRKGANDIINHSAVCLDYDGVENGKAFLEHIDNELKDINYMYYSTTKSTNAVLRLRVIIPLATPAVDDEYQALARQFIKKLGTDGIDKTSFENNRAMGYTVLLKGQPYVYKSVTDKPFLDKDEFFKAESIDWKDASTWFYLPSETKEEQENTKRATASKARDEFVEPTDLRGWVGTFCRTFSLSAAFAKFLPDMYVPAGGNRYTYKYGSTTGGVLTWDDRGFKTYHATDPARGARNAFEVVQYHLYGTDANARKKMIELCKNDTDVIATKNHLKPEEMEVPEYAQNWLDFAEYPANDWGTAKRLLDVYKDSVGWATDAKWWMLYVNNRWEDTDTSVLYGYFDRVASIMRALSATVRNAEDIATVATIINQCQTSRYRDSILKALKPMVMLTKGEMDSDDNGMNTTQGYLRFNQNEYIIPSSPEQHCRKIAGGGFGKDFIPDQECLNFLQSMFPDDDLYHWVHKWFGYCLTGSTSEKKLVFLYGKRNNGKSSLITLAKNAFGDYQTIGDENMLLSTKFGGSDTDSPTPSIAKLQGVRLCLIDEMPKGRKLNGSAIKRMTHGVGLKGRDLNQSTITFPFLGKICVACNDIPSMGADAWDTALKMRIRIVPFTKILSAKDIDTTIEDKVNSKAWKDTFLYWCYEGLQYYKEEKLDNYTGDSLEDSNMPAIMKLAMKKYFKESDDIGDFIETYCEVTGDKNDFVPLCVLYDMYVEEQKTGYSLSKKMFSQMVASYMEEHGCETGRKYCKGVTGGAGKFIGGNARSQQRGWFGIRMFDVNFD